MTLHPCPYCSCPLVSVERNEEGGAVVACGSCGMTGPESVDGDEGEAIRGWELLCRKMCRNCRRVYLERIRGLRKELDMANNGDRRLNWKQACSLLGCSKSTLYKLIRQGRLSAYGVGSRFRFVMKSDCERLLAEGECTGRAGDKSPQPDREG